MPSFLSKVFGRKKDDKESSSQSHNHGADPELLDGKFEAVSPSATKFPEVANGRGAAAAAAAAAGASSKEKEKETGFTLFRVKSPASASYNTSGNSSSNVPHLSLNLPEPKDDPASTRALGVVFEADPDTQLLLSDAVIGSRRLNPLETLILVRACSQAIKARGIETLGIMHPHWHSASPDVQKRLISLFILSLDPKSPITTLSPSPSSLVSAFESEISTTRSPYDVAAVLRWGIRHLQLEGGSFGKEDSWYKKFFDSERSSNYPPNAFSKLLGPSLPASHFELLTVTLEIFMSLAAHAEVNGISGSKLSKFLGLWLLTLQRTQETDHWSEFYSRWERAGRILEHLFLARIRDEAVGSGMPRRLLELVRNYPYGSATPDADLLPYLRFSTRRYDALFVRIETELSVTADRPAHHPLRLISEALRAEISTGSEEQASLWETIRKRGNDDSGTSSPGSSSGLSRILADETIRFFALLPAENGSKDPASPFSLHIEPTRKRSFSLGEKNVSTTGSDAAKPSTQSDVKNSGAIGTDWSTFSTSGFFEGVSEKIPLATTLLDKQKDMEVTVSKVPASRSKPLVSALANGRKSLDTPRAKGKVDATKHEEARPVSKTTRVSLIQLDEAFVDFWSDALLDPISSNWPAFIVCKLKSTLSDVEVDGKRLEWLVIEQAFTRPQPATPISPETLASPESASRPRPSSPKSEISFGSVRKRFSFFTSSRSFTSPEKDTKRKTKVGKSPRVGEMGEVLAEEDENKEHAQDKGKPESNIVKVRIPSPKPKKSVDVSRKSVDVAKKSHEGESRTAGAGIASESHLTNGAAAENQAASVPAVPETKAPSEQPTVLQEPLSTSSPDQLAPQVALVQPQEVEKIREETDDHRGHADSDVSPPADLVNVPTEQSHRPDGSAVAESDPLNTTELSPPTQPPPVAPEQSEAAKSTSKTELEQPAAILGFAKPISTITASDETEAIPSKVENNGTIVESDTMDEKSSKPETQPQPVYDAETSDAADIDAMVEPSSVPGTEETTSPVISEIPETSSGTPEATITAPNVSSEAEAPSEEFRLDQPTGTHGEITPKVHAKEFVPETEVTDPVTANGEATDTTPPLDQVEDKDAVPSSVNKVASEPTTADAHIEEEPSNPPSNPIFESEPQPAFLEHDGASSAPVLDIDASETAPANDEEPSADAEITQSANGNVQDTKATSEPETLPATEDLPTSAAEIENKDIPLSSESEPLPAAEAPPALVADTENKESAIPPTSELEATEEPSTSVVEPMKPAPVDGEVDIQAASDEIQPPLTAAQELTPEVAIAHSEPLNIPEESDADKGVTLPDVPIVEVEPTLPTKEDDAPAVEESAATPVVDTVEAESTPNVEVTHDAAAENGESSAVQSVVSAGNTPGPQTILDAVMDSTEPGGTVAEESIPSQEELEMGSTSQAEATAPGDAEISVPSTETQPTEVHDESVFHSEEGPPPTVENTAEQTADETPTQPELSIPTVDDDTTVAPSPTQEQA